MKPLSRKIRILSLVLMLFAFVVLAPMILAYSLGYRFDDAYSLVKTGGIYIHSNTANTEVYLNGEFVQNNGLLLRNTLIQDLRPGFIYTAWVTKDGHHSWTKELEVRPTLVTEARVLMLPIEIEQEDFFPYFDLNGFGTTTVPVLATSTISEISETEEEQESADELKNDEYYDLELLFEYVVATSTETVNPLLNGLIATTTEEVDIPEYFIELGVTDPDDLDNLLINGDEISWLVDGNIVIYWIGKEDSIPYYYCNIEKCETMLTLDWGTEIIRFDYLPGRNDVWVVLNEEGLWAVEVDDRSERNVQPIYLGENLDFRINQANRIVVYDEELFIELRI